MFASVAWVRVGIAAILSEVAVMICIGVGIFVVRWRTGEPINTTDGPNLGERVGYRVAPAAAFFATFACALWAIRSLPSDYLLNGFLVGLIAVILTFAFLFGARPEHRLMYCVSFALRLVGGILAGLAAPRL
jgi:hypothetical protein